MAIANQEAKAAGAKHTEEWIQSFALRELKTSGIWLTFLSCCPENRLFSNSHFLIRCSSLTLSFLMYSIRIFSVRRCGYLHLLLLIHWKPGNFYFLFDEWLPSSFLLLTWLNSSASAGGMIDPISRERPKAASYLAISLLIEPNSAKSLAKADVPSQLHRASAI